MPELIKPAEFARRMGVSRMAVTKAMQNQRLRESVVERDGRKWLDAAIATEEWEGNRQQMRITDLDKPPSKHAQHTPKQPARSTPPADDGVPDEPGGQQQAVPALGNAAYNQARAFREQYQARLARLEYEEKSGRLIATEQVKIAQFKQGQRVREAVLSIPDRVAAALAAALGAEIDPHTVHTAMETELRNVLQELAQNGRGIH